MVDARKTNREMIRDLTMLLEEGSSSDLKRDTGKIFSKMSVKGIAKFYSDSSGPGRKVCLDYVYSTTRNVEGDFWMYATNPTLITPQDLDD